MSELNDFRAMKEQYRTPEGISELAREHSDLKSYIETDKRSHDLQQLAHDYTKLAVLDLAIGDAMRDRSDGSAANIMFNEALESMKAAKKAGADISDLIDLARQVGKHKS